MNLPAIEIVRADKTGTTLVEQIRSIDNLFGDTEAHKTKKEQRIHEAFELWKGKNLLVSAVVKGDITFAQTYQNILGEYNSLLRLSMPYSLPENFKERVHDLEVCIGESNLNDSIIHKMSRNTIGGFASGVILGSLYLGYKAVRSRYPKKDEKLADPSKRKFLKTLLGVGVTGLVYGATESLSAKEQLDKIERNADYLDNMYMKVYSDKN